MDTREDVAIAIQIEGLGYFLTRYASADLMPDDELRKAFINVSQAINYFESLLPEVEEM